MNELALFAGAGGGILGGLACGFRTVCAVELAEYPRRVLLARQRDGYLPRFPIWDDVCTFDGRPWRGHVDVITGGFPCQDISSAGKRAGITGARSGLWREYARIIGEVRPAFVLAENSPHLRTRGLDVVLSDLAAIGYDAEWGVLGAADVGAPHRRDRMWIFAHSDRDAIWEQHRRLVGASWESPAKRGLAMRCANSDYGRGRMGAINAEAPGGHEAARHHEWPQPPGNPRVADGMAHRMDRVRATGNGQVARVAGVAWAGLLRRALQRMDESRGDNMNNGHDEISRIIGKDGDA